MKRQAERTLFSLRFEYQTGAIAADYEVFAIDKRSPASLDPDRVAGFGPNFRYHRHETKSVSSVDVVNLGAEMAQGRNIAVIMDCARMASPGLA